MFEDSHMWKVKKMQCCTCIEQVTRTQAHHVLDQGQRIGDMATIPLCRECHTGPQGVHGDKTMLRIAGKTELQFMNETLTELYA